MALNFNVDPYYDDFNDSNNFHRILFKPGVAVQARELTQAQSILQDQITKFADNIFRQNSPVTGGQVTTNFSCYYVKLKSTYNETTFDVTDFNNLLVQNSTGSVRARVLGTASSTGEGGDPPTLVVSYLTQGQFSNNDIIYDTNSNLAAQAVENDASGLSSTASISDGVFYTLGNFVQVSESTIILSKYDNTPSLRVGLTITETINDYIDNPSLLDPAIGESNYQAPGADRYVISLKLDTRPLQFGDDADFIELVRIEEGSVYKMVDGSVYAVIDDYFAKRDYETNGDYVVNDFKLTPKTDTANSQNYIMSVGKGLAYVHGYRVENPAPIDITSTRARSQDSQNNNPVYINYGNYLYINNVKGNTSFFDVTTSESIDIHSVPYANISTTNATTYNSTLVGTARIRNIQFDTALGSYSNTASYVYKAYIHDVQTYSLSANVVSATSNSVVLATNCSSANGAYVGVNITISKGTDAGDYRYITAYDGTTRTATLNQNWTITPDATSVYVLDFDIKDAESVVTSTKTSTPYVLQSRSNIANSGKTGNVSSGDTILENPTVPELIFNVGNKYVSSITDTSYTTTQVFRNIAFTSTGVGSVSAQLNYEGEYLNIIRHLGTPGTTLSNDLVRQNYTIVCVNKGSNSTINVGDIIPWTTPNRTVTLDDDASIATFTSSDLSPFTATLVAKVFVENGNDASHILKIKNYIKANGAVVVTTGTQVNTNTYVDDSPLTSSGQIYIKQAGLVAPGQKQSLYLCDVKEVVRIIDTQSAAVLPTTDMVNNPIYDITNSYIFNSGQTDTYYDHAYLTLRPGASQPKGNILVYVNYYQHSGGDGYFSKLSYIDNATLNDEYRNLPVYKSSNGTVYNLRDCIDFRPARRNATTSFIFRTANPSDTTKSGTYIPFDTTVFTCDYAYYLGRKDKLILTKDRSLNIIQGSPSLVPVPPSEPDAALVIAILTHNPYTGYLPSETNSRGLPDLSIDKVQHKRYTMKDIAGLESRISNVEYYTSLSLLEKNAESLQISDSYGLNRFKNGILVDDFSGYSTSDTYNEDFYASINRRTRQMTCAQLVNNYPLKNYNLLQNFGNLSTSAAAALNYKVNRDNEVNYYTLPYTSANLTSQKIASRTVNINPFSFSVSEGVASLSPNVDNWVDNTAAPSLLIVDPNLQVFRQSNTVNVLQVGDWQTISSVTVQTGSSTSSWQTTLGPEENHRGEDWGFGMNVGRQTTVGGSSTTTSFQTTTQQLQNNIMGFYNNIGNTYSLNNGYLTDISILPWMRAQQVAVRVNNLLQNSELHTFFDGTNVDGYVRKANIIELSNVSGTFFENDTVGYISASTFIPTARVLGVKRYSGTNNVRLYVASDQFTTQYSSGTTLVSASFNTSGAYQSTIASGTITSSSHFGGRIRTANSTTQLQLSALASSTSGYYNGNTIYFMTGNSAGRSATISGYDGTTKTVTIGSTLTYANNDIYSIGSFSSDSDGSFYCIFNLPANMFHSGERVFRVDNRVGGNVGSATTHAQATFYSQGLASTSQALDFGASPAGARNTFTQTNTRTLVSNFSTTSDSSWSVSNPWDPVAQTFIVDGVNYPNGVFLKSLKVFFKTKPAIDNSPVTLSIVGTLNGYPNGETLDHSIVTVSKDQIKTSSSPHYLDPNTYTEFEFNSPVYIQPNTMYAFILKSASNEYNMWTAFNGDNAVASSVRNLPSDPLPSQITKINSVPYVGSLFKSQNAQTWTTDQNESIMFTLERCVFDITKTPSIRFVVPKMLPQRALIEQSIEYVMNANNVANNASTSNTTLFVDAFNVTTTDFLPTTTTILYSYSSTLQGGNSPGTVYINPGKLAASMPENIHLDDGNGRRILDANTDTSFSVYAQMVSTSNTVSPVLSDAGLTVYAIEHKINNCELSNSVITIANTGLGYNANTTLVTVSAPTGKNGTQAYVAANVANGQIQSVYVTYPGSGYIETPTITITDANTTPGVGANVIVAGETSSSGGTALAKYITKRVTLDAGYDSGDINVYMTAYRPVGTDIHVYYKILNRNDTSNFSDMNWQLMTKIRSSDGLYAQSRGEMHEYVFAPGVNGSANGYVSYTNSNGLSFTSFSQFAIKVVVTTNDKTNIPMVQDIRCIALPQNATTIF